MDQTTSTSIGSGPTAEGDPTRLAVHVQRIDSVVQSRGRFEIERWPDKHDVLVPLNVLDPVQIRVEGDRVKAEVRFSGEFFRHGIPESEPGARVFIAEAVYVAVYTLEPESPREFAEADLQAFLAINVPMNLVPFWREFVHSATSRAGLPPYAAPIFNPFKIAKSLFDDKGGTAPAGAAPT